MIAIYREKGIKMYKNYNSYYKFSITCVVSKNDLNSYKYSSSSIHLIFMFYFYTLCNV